MNLSASSSDLELIAAFLDGRLQGEEKARAIRLLADSEPARETFANALRSQSGVVDQNILPFRAPRPRYWKVVIPLAAAAALAITVSPSLRSRQEPSEFAARDLAVLLVDNPLVGQRLGAGWEQRSMGPTRRGAASAGVRRLDSVAPALTFRLGVRSVDLQLALANGDTAVARRLDGEIEEMLRSIGFADVPLASYAELGSGLATAPREQSIERASSAERELSELLNSSAFSVGKWVAAAELAARTRNGAFFKAKITTHFIRSTIARDALSAEDSRTLERTMALSAGDMIDSAFDEIRDLLQQMIRRRGG